VKGIFRSAPIKQGPTIHIDLCEGDLEPHEHTGAISKSGASWVS